MKQTNSGETEENRVLIPRRPIRRVGLLSPTSGNLGNATMQASMIANLRKRLPNVEFLGITLNPDETKRRHGIEAFPLAVGSRANYSVTMPGARPGVAMRPGRIKQWLKQIPGLRPFIRSIRSGLAGMIHIVASGREVRKLNCIIVPGGGALDDLWGGPWGHPWVLFKWSLLCRMFKVPFLFVSIGKCYLESPISRFLVRVVLRLATFRSYRDPNSKAAVQSLVDASRDPVYPDLAFSFPQGDLPPWRRNCGAGGPFVVGVSPIAYCDPRAWPRKDKGRYTAYITRLAEIVNWLLGEGYRVLFFTTDSPDAGSLEDIRAMISGPGLDSGAIQSLAGSSEISPKTLMDELSCADLVIASRLHGVIISHLIEIPVLALSFDPKVDAHMKSVGQQDYCLDIDHFEVATAVERFTALKIRREPEAAQLRSMAVAFRRQLDEQYDMIAGIPHAAHAEGEFPIPVQPSGLPEIGSLRS
jgi:polysaccharide pyruvyl transferase WcaK-like protein